MVLFRRHGAWQEPAVQVYGNEKELQHLLQTAPSLLPSSAPLAVVNEFWIPDVGSVDLVGVDTAGVITVVECKLRANPQIRREVVGQALAYAGGLWEMTFEAFADTFAKRAGKSLFAAVHEASGVEITDEELRQGVAGCLATGAFRIVIAVDAITEELKRCRGVPQRSHHQCGPGVGARAAIQQGRRR